MPARYVPRISTKQVTRVIKPYRAGIWKQPPKSRELGKPLATAVQRGNVDYMITSDKVEKLRGWFSGRLPEGIYSEIIDLTVDREEITVLGRIPEPSVGDGATPAEREAAAEGRIAEFRERTREQRMEVAREAERRYGRKVSWAVQCGDTKASFTNVSAPVMTRLRQPDRIVLDTLVDAGVARSRSEALAWCVRMVQKHSDTWLADLRDSLEKVKQVREQGPDKE